MPASGAPYLRQVEAKLRIELHPSQSKDVKVAVHEHLNSLLMRYNDEFGGVVLSYTDVILLGSKGRILTTLSPYIHLDLTAKLLVFAPAAQHVLVGSVNKVGPAHIGLLALGTFNGSIAADKIGDPYEYDYDASAWVSGSSKIAVGTEIKFTVLRVHDEGSFLSLSGALLPAEIGPEGSLGTIGAREDASGSGEAAQLGRKHKKRKAQQTSDSPVDAGLHALEEREPLSDQAEVPEERGKKKKKRKLIEEGAQAKASEPSEGLAPGPQVIKDSRRGKDKGKRKQ